MKTVISQWLGKWLMLSGVFAWQISSLSAANLTWTGAAGDGRLSTAGNWASGTAPVSGDTLMFSGTDGAALTLNNDLGTTVGAFQFYGTTAYTVTGGTLNIPNGNNAGFMNYGASPLTVQPDVNMNNGVLQTENGQVNASNITITGTVYNLGRFRQYMVGGTLTVGGINTAGSVVIGGIGYNDTHPIITGKALPVTVVGNIVGTSFSNYYGGEVQYGEIRLTGSNTLAGDTSLTDGNLVLDYSVTDARKLANGFQLNFTNAGRLTLVGGTTQEVVSNLNVGHYNYTVGGGQTVIERVSGSATINVTSVIGRSGFLRACS